MSAAGLEDVLANLAGDQLAGMAKDSEEFGEKMKKQHEQVDQSFDRLIGKLGGAKGKGQPEYPDEVKAIANMLVAYPKLIPIFQSIIARLLKSMEQSFDAIAAEYTNMGGGGAA